jgi:hypothetical protein
MPAFHGDGEIFGSCPAAINSAARRGRVQMYFSVGVLVIVIDFLRSLDSRRKEKAAAAPQIDIPDPRVSVCPHV